ncbi:EAL domain-containing protein [Candidatus Albibeggiatoa sp. nov. NOAA]|uniref:EAL domain-containing protein n=1 Tax=Candidatus Albibeggiatoa sp. nov. NOAA TaxID=3162724 RepID=UPI0032FFEA6D|nr:EAL domain-containing protein [Thiotrichaceae bacterium]
MADYQGHILVVDDAPLMRKVLAEILQKFGYKVKTADNGQQAIDYFIEHRPELILMDADMPTLDGVTACQRIKSLPEAKYLPVIIVTAYVGREWVDKAYAAGATDYVTKPVNWDVLRNRIHYILQAKRAEEALFDEKEKAQVTLASIGDGVITTDAKGLIEYVNPIATCLTGWSHDEARGKPINQVFSLINEVSKSPVHFPIEECLESRQVIELTDDGDNIVLQHRNGQHYFAIEDSAAPIQDRHGNIIGVVLVFHDMTENRRMTQKLSFQAKHDALTTLFNRHEFNNRLHDVLQQPRHQDIEHALLYLDLDQFKIVNDTCGHDAGDQLLKDVAILLQTSVNEFNSYAKATLARLGGDEFALLLEQCKLQDALLLAHKLCDDVQNLRFFWTDEKNKLTRRVFKIGISIGLMPITDRLSDKTTNQKSVLAMADAACYAAKNAGRNNVHIYKDTDLAEEIEWVSVINNNLEKNTGFHLFYQPINSLKDSQYPKFYEVLLRMDDRQGHLAPPGAFLSTAARYNLMPTLDLYVIEQTLVWISHNPVRLQGLNLCSINISAYSLADQNFLKQVKSYLLKTHVPLNKICFEITETTAISNFTGAQHFIQEIKALGCKIAMDDFGTGISAFSFLKKLPIDFLKIDGNLIRHIADDEVNYAMVKSINDIAHLMNIETIAEFVENEDIFNKLQELNVDYIQGFWVGKPQPLQDGPITLNQDIEVQQPTEVL